MKDLNVFEGLSLDENLVNVEGYEKNLQTALSLVESLIRDFPDHHDPLVSAALSSAILTANNLLTSSHTKCTLVHPPEPIDSVIDSSGNIILRCYHSPHHEWDLSGNKK
jgi:hypothetical protein